MTKTTDTNAKDIEKEIREKFRRSGYTLTSQRRAVLDALTDFKRRPAKGHPSAEEIYFTVKKKNPRVALGTVYQALSVLEEIGIIEAKYWSESPTRYDLNTNPHCDIRCTKCGKVEEISDTNMGDLKASLQHNTPYHITKAAVVVEGICPACQSAN